jgi:hypothetical protein
MRTTVDRGSPRENGAPCGAPARMKNQEKRCTVVRGRDARLTAMQLTGQPCAACSERLVIQDEGTWCGRCRTVFHKKCQPKSECPRCHQEFMDPTLLFVRSEYCPKCMTPNVQALSNCLICGADTEWDRAEDYIERMHEIHREAKKLLLVGCIELVIATTAIASFLLAAAFGGVLRFLVALAAIAFIDGLRRVVSGRSFLQFK